MKDRTQQMMDIGADSEAQHSAGSPFAGVAASHEVIARRAYDIYMKTGRIEGHCEENWLKAEKETGAGQMRSMEPAGAKPTAPAPAKSSSTPVFKNILGVKKPTDVM
jgi:Protein of unknown function (DUF2934)